VVDLSVYAAAAAGRNTLHQHHHLSKET